MQYIATVLLLTVCSLIVTTLYIKVCKAKYQEWFYIFSFFVAVMTFVLTITKYYLGYHKENLFESFWNIQMITLVHYSIPLIIIGIIMIIGLKLCLKENAYRVIRYFDSTVAMTVAAIGLVVRYINNRVFCTAFFMAILITGIYAIFSKKDIIYTSMKNIRGKIVNTVPFILLWMITIVIYIPNELYLNNMEDFPMSYWYFFGKLLIAGVIVTSLLLLTSLLYLSEKQQYFFSILLFYMLIIGYIQGIFLNGSLKTLDGTAQVWRTREYICNLLIWGVLMGIFTWILFVKKEKIWKLMKIVCIWLSLTQIVSLGVMIVSAGNLDVKEELTLTTDGMLEVSDSNNIIVFVLDKFDGRIIEEILKEDQTFLEPLKDFTQYENVTSEFMPTENSIPYLLTGTEYNDESDEKYVSYAYDEDDVLIKQLYDCGYDVGIYTNPRYVTENMKSIISNYEDGIERKCNMWDLFKLMTQCSKYRMAPLIGKNYYQYDTVDIALLVVEDRITNIEDDLPFYHRLVNQGLRIMDNSMTSGAFRFIHMHGAHPPYTMTQDFQYLSYDARRDDGYGDGISQAKGALKIVYEYITQLKELGKYKDATIIITADHGYTGSLNKNGVMEEISYPILFVKEPQEDNNVLEINTAPVCHADVLETIRSISKANNANMTLKDVTQNMNRMRFLRVCNGDFYEKYEIDGEVSDIKAWKMLYSNQN